jgi:hypothetical protein
LFARDAGSIPAASTILRSGHGARFRAKDGAFSYTWPGGSPSLRRTMTLKKCWANEVKDVR